jgi:CHAD domain-containing protein
MATDTREIEWKYEAPPNTPLPDLTDLPRVAAQTQAQDETLDAVYYDTETFDLARAGITLRRRSGGGDAGWHLKIPEERAGVRAELRLPASAGTKPAASGGNGDGAAADGPPKEFATLLTARVRGRKLRPVARVSTHRRRSILMDTEDHALAEIALDAVTAESLGRDSGLTRWNEIEIELADGVDAGEGLLKAADRQLRHRGLRRSSRPTKLHTALAHSLDAVESGMEAAALADGARASSAAPILAYLREQFEELTAWDLAVRRDEYDSIHQMRVAARRLRATFQVYGPLFQLAATREIVGNLRWLGELLGRARDEEVISERLSAEIGAVPAELVLGPVAARVTGHYAPRQAAARREALKALSSSRYVALLRGLETLLEKPPLSEYAEKDPAAVPELAYRAHRRVRQRMRSALQTPEGPDRDLALHEVRKAAKRARYAAEAAEFSYGKQARRSARDYKKLQSLLGDQHDAVIGADALRKLAIHAHIDGENAFTFGLLHQRQLDTAERLARKVPGTWKRVGRRKRAAWMKKRA